MNTETTSKTNGHQLNGFSSEDIGDDHLFTSLDTPMKPNAFEMSNDEKKQRISILFSEIVCQFHKNIVRYFSAHFQKTFQKMFQAFFFFSVRGFVLHVTTVVLYSTLSQFFFTTPHFQRNLQIALKLQYVLISIQKPLVTFFYLAQNLNV